MNELPDGWSGTTIGKVVVKKVEQRTPLSTEYFYYIDISSIDRAAKKIVNPQKLSGKEAPSRARQVVARGDVLVSMTRPNLNAVAMISSDLDGQIASTGFDVLRAKDIESRWLYYLVRTQDFITAMSNLVRGALYPAVRPGDIRNYAIPLAPLNEQKRIAAKLDSLLARVDEYRKHLDRIPQIFKLFRESVLAAAMSGQLTEEWRKLKDNSSGSTFSSELFDIPAGWKWINIQDIGVVKGGKRLPFGETLVNQNTGFPYIRAGQLKNGTVLSVDQKYLLPQTQKQISRYIVNAGDVYLTIVGANIGDAGVIPENYDKANLTENVAKICELKGVTSKYLAFWLRSPYSQDLIQSSIKSGAQGKLALNRIKVLPVPLPPLAEQDEIVRHVESLLALADRIAAHINTAEKQMLQLIPSLLAKAFRGELVESDPNDEPANFLLERIKEAKYEQQPMMTIQTIKSREIREYKMEESLEEIIQSLPRDTFSFDDLQEKFLGDYESLKAQLFRMLGDEKPIISQVFDKSVQTMRFVRRKR